MAWAPLLLTLLAHCAEAASQVVVTQEPSLSMTPGGTVTLTCGSSAGAVTTGNYAAWVQQMPYQAPRGLIGGTSNRYSGVPARFSGSLLGGKAALTITGAQPEDEAEYFCALWYSNHYHGDRLTCTLSSGFSVGDYYISWYQQKPGSRPRYLLYYYSDSNKHQASGVPSRFSGSKDTSANAGVLHISGLEPEDEADYYCGSWAQSVLTQPSSVSGALGQRVTTSCAGSSNNTGIFDVHWAVVKAK
ncbi:Ig lambda-2 chain V [Tupaia chinensis]|uniref:Ig lambda-2 chain V n=1 Tax=Tupaia chinensis TaxID=246437 RepID=L9K106_TUPCH|nr:Ig lambda-2 chain V [Tupaia chinensis]